MHVHHHHHMRWRRMGPMGRYVRTRLRRRLFVWFGWAIITTALAVGVTMMTLGNPWWKDYQGALEFLANESAKDWDNPAARDARLYEAAHAVNANIELRSPTGQLLSTTGEECQHTHFKVPVMRNGVPVGQLTACYAA